MPEPVLVPFNEIYRVWPLAEPFIKEAVATSRGRHDETHVRADCEEGRTQLWLAVDGANVRAVAVTSIQDYPLRRLCRISIVDGRGLKAWIDLKSHIEDWARSKGCTGVEAWARPGMERVAADYQKTHVLLEKDL